MDFINSINEYLTELKRTIDRLDIKQIDNLMNVLLYVYNNDGRIYIFGNGGSASTASHFVNDFNKGVSEKLNKRFKFICLNDNTSTLMAVANDISYDEVFKFQLINFLEKEDMVIGISGSGNSENVIKAIEYAKSRGVLTAVLVGYDGGILKELADHCVHIPIDDMQKVEDLHIMVDHVMMKILKKYLEVI